MPELDGYETIRGSARCRVRVVPIISLTAKAMKGDREKSIAAGASDYITKPVDIDQLVSLLRVWLYRPHAVQADGSRAPRRARSTSRRSSSTPARGVFRRYGYDFREYAPASLRRRVNRRVHLERLSTISALQDRLLRDPRSCSGCCSTSRSTSPRCSAIRRSTSRFASRSSAPADVPVHADLGRRLLDRRGGLLARDPARGGGAVRPRPIYATDINEEVLERARTASSRRPRCRSTRQLHRRRRQRSFSEYYTSGYDGAAFDRSLLRNVVFAQHNLAMDSSFNEFHMIVCRNVMIYFERSLQERVFELFDDSLARLGILGLGHKESLRTSAHSEVRGAGCGRAHLPQGERGVNYELVVSGHRGAACTRSGACSTGSATRSAPRSSSLSTAARGGRAARAAPPAPDAAAVREAEDKDSCTRAGLPRAARLPHADRGRRNDRAVDRGRRAVRAPVDRRPLPVGRGGVSRAVRRRGAHRRERGRRRRARADQGARRRRGRAGSARRPSGARCRRPRSRRRTRTSCCHSKRSASSSAACCSDGARPERCVRAGGGTRTHGRRFTKAVLYQLSYSGAARQRSALYCRTSRDCWCVRIFRLTRWSALSIVFVSQPSSSAISS